MEGDEEDVVCYTAPQKISCFTICSRCFYWKLLPSRLHMYPPGVASASH